MMGVRVWRCVRRTIQSSRQQLIPIEQHFFCTGLVKYCFGTVAFEMAPKRNRKESSDESASFSSDESDTQQFAVNRVLYCVEKLRKHGSPRKSKRKRNYLQRFLLSSRRSTMHYFERSVIPS